MLPKSTFKNKMNCSGTYYTGFTAVQYTIHYTGIIVGLSKLIMFGFQVAHEILC